MSLGFFFSFLFSETMSLVLIRFLFFLPPLLSQLRLERGAIMRSI
jgi:hypothetical protein